MNMNVFKRETETKRVIFNVRADLAVRLDKAKADARKMGRKLDIDAAVDEAVEKFLKKAEKKLAELLRDPTRQHAAITDEDMEDSPEDAQ